MDLLLTRREAAGAGRVRSLLLGALIAVAAFAIAPASAFAAGSVNVDGSGVLRYAGGDEDNVVSIASNGPDYVVTDQTGITAGSGCSPDASDSTRATCPVASVTTRIETNAGAGNNTVALDATVTLGAIVFGGPGNDTVTGGAGADTLGGAGGNDVINAVDGVTDQIFCGGGTDRFSVDSIDQLLPDPSTCEDDGVPPDTAITSAPPDLSGSGTATFEFTSSDGSPTFECSIDGGATWEGCGSPKSYNLSDGAYTFSVRAIDAFGHADASPATYQWTVDLGAPNINIDGPTGTINTDSATFRFSSPDSDLKRFDCRIDGSDWVECSSPITLSFLPDGPHTFSVRAVDKAGNVGALTLSFTVAVLKSGVVSRPASSLVLIAGNTVKVTKRGYAYIALNCSGTRDCAGRVLLDTSKKVRAGRKKRKVRLGRAKFQIKATRTRRVRIHISRSKMRLLRKLRKVNTDIIVRDLDGAGRARVSSRTIVLKAPPRR
jgi:RTX calcium-binding nonapeptide repeat (4 copies)